MFRLLRVLLITLVLAPFTALAAPVDINTADAATLEQVKGIGPTRAKAIVEYRQKNGPFAKVDDLTQVPGIGEKSLAKLRAELTASGGAKQAKAK